MSERPTFDEWLAHQDLLWQVSEDETIPMQEAFEKGLIPEHVSRHAVNQARLAYLEQVYEQRMDPVLFVALKMNVFVDLVMNKLSEMAGQNLEAQVVIRRMLHGMLETKYEQDVEEKLTEAIKGIEEQFQEFERQARMQRLRHP